MTTTNITAGKLAGLKAVSDARGVIAAAAMDQRGSLKKSLAKEKGVSDLPDSALIEFKELVTEVLTKYASAILLDPEYGLPAAKRRHRAWCLPAIGGEWPSHASQHRRATTGRRRIASTRDPLSGTWF